MPPPTGRCGARCPRSTRVHRPQFTERVVEAGRAEDRQRRGVVPRAAATTLAHVHPVGQRPPLGRPLARPLPGQVEHLGSPVTDRQHGLQRAELDVRGAGVGDRLPHPEHTVGVEHEDDRQRQLVGHRVDDELADRPADGDLVPDRHERSSTDLPGDPRPSLPPSCSVGSSVSGHAASYALGDTARPCAATRSPASVADTGPVSRPQCSTSGQPVRTRRHHQPDAAATQHVHAPLGCPARARSRSTTVMRSPPRAARGRRPRARRSRALPGAVEQVRAGRDDRDVVVAVVDEEQDPEPSSRTRRTASRPGGAVTVRGTARSSTTRSTIRCTPSGRASRRRTRRRRRRRGG